MREKKISHYLENILAIALIDSFLFSVYKLNKYEWPKCWNCSKIKTKTRNVLSFRWHRSSYRRFSIYKGVFKSLAIFRGKQLCRTFFESSYEFQACNIIKKETSTQVFSCDIFENFRNTFYIKHLGETTSDDSIVKYLTL